MFSTRLRLSNSGGSEALRVEMLLNLFLGPTIATVLMRAFDRIASGMVLILSCFDREGDTSVELLRALRVVAGITGLRFVMLRRPSLGLFLTKMPSS